MKALTFGSLNIDFTYKVDHFVQKGETISTQSLQVFTGGKGLNQSIALAKAGAEVYHAGAIGEDGKMLLEAMEKAGVHTEYIDIRKDVRTGNAIIQTDVNGDNCILLYGGANKAITKEQADRVLADFSAGDYLILQNEINQLPYIMESAHKAGMKIVLNPSPMNKTIHSLPLDMVDIFILNEVEAMQILETYDGKGGEALAKKISERFPGALIVLTLGSEGSVCIDGENVITQPAFKVEVVDTTAAGDTFTGFFIQGVMRGQKLEDVMRLASKASSIAVTRPGAAPSIPALEEVEASLRGSAWPDRKEKI